MSDQFTNVGKNLRPQGLNVGSQMDIVAPDQSRRSSQVSAIGQDNAKVLTKAQRVWDASVRQFAQQHQSNEMRQSSGAYQPADVTQQELSELAALEKNENGIEDENDHFDEPSQVKNDSVQSNQGDEEDLELNLSNENDVGGEDIEDQDDFMDPYDISLSDDDREIDPAEEQRQLREQKKKQIERKIDDKRGFQEARVLKAKITPEALKRTRAEKIRTLPVYVCARPLANAAGPMKRMGLHGFVAIGQPGLGSGGDKIKKDSMGRTNAQGAKVFSYGSSPMSSSLKFGKKVANQIANAKDADGNAKFSDETIRAVKAMSAHKTFRSFQDFHRVYFTERTRNEMSEDPDFAALEKQRSENKVVMERLEAKRDKLKKEGKKLSKPEKEEHWQTRRKFKLAESKLKVKMDDTHTKINQEALKIYKHLESSSASGSGGSVFGKSELVGSTASSKYQSEKFPKMLQHPTEKDAQNYINMGAQYKTFEIPDEDLPLAEMDARMFEQGDYEDVKGFSVRRQHGVKATDVIEAQRMQSIARNYRNEKARMIDGSILAPELLAPPDIDRKSYTECRKLQEAQLALANDYFDETGYAPIKNRQDGGQRIAPRNEDDPVLPKPHNQNDGISKKAIQDQRAYSALTVGKKGSNGVGSAVSVVKNAGSKKGPLRNKGNCNSAAGSLVRLAGKLNGKRVQAEGGGLQIGLNKDVTWDPTPNVRPRPQQQSEYVATGQKPPEEIDDNSDAGSDVQINQMDPSEDWLKDVTDREIKEMQQSARSMNAAFRDLVKTDQLMKKHTPKPRLRFKAERFQAVRDAMAGFLGALPKGLDTRRLANTAKIADNFREMRMDEYFRKNDKEFDTSALNATELEMKLGMKGTTTGMKKMMLADHAQRSANKLQAERQKLFSTLDATLSKSGRLSDVEIRKLEVGVSLIANLGHPDRYADALMKRAQTAIDHHRGVG